jgi:hypothetical protein
MTNRSADDHARRVQVSDLADDLIDMIPMERVEAQALLMRELLDSIVAYARREQIQLLDDES